MIIQRINKLGWIGVVAMAMMISACSVTEKTASSKATAPLSTPLTGAKKVAFDETYFSALSSKYAGDLKMAVMYFEQCLKLDPENDAVRYELSQVALQLNAFDKAKEHALYAVSSQPDNRWYLENYAVVCQKSGDYIAAATSYQKLVDSYPKQLPYYYNLASAYLYANNVPMAIQTYERLESVMGYETQLGLQLVKLYVDQKQYNDAEAKLLEIISHHPGEVKYQAMLANFYQEQGDVEKAIAIYEEMKIAAPNDPYVKMALYEFYSAQNKRTIAFENLNGAFASEEIGVNPKLKIILGILDQAQTDSTLFPQVDTLFEVVVQVHPNDASGYAFYGEYLSNRKQLEKAQAMLIQSISLDSGVFQVWNQLLFVESDLNATDSLVKHATACIELYPNQVLPYYFAGAVYLQQKAYPQAIEYLEGARELAFGFKELAIQIDASLGDAYYQSGNYQKAWLAYESALRQNPDNEYVLNNYAYFLCLEGEEMDKALEMSKKTVVAQPNNAVYLDTYGWILYTNKQYQEAVSYLQKAADADQHQSPEILEHLGDAYYKLGDRDAAISWWKRAQSAGGESDELMNKIKKGAL